MYFTERRETPLRLRLDEQVAFVAAARAPQDEIAELVGIADRGVVAQVGRASYPDADRVIPVGDVADQRAARARHVDPDLVADSLVVGDDPRLLDQNARVVHDQQIAGHDAIPNLNPDRAVELYDIVLHDSDTDQNPTGIGCDAHALDGATQVCRL